MDFDGESRRHPYRRKDQASSVETLHFLKAYPRQATVCSTVGGSTGAIDPKTLRKYMWPFIRAIADLEPALVSINIFSFLHLSNLTHLVSSRLISKAGKIVAV